MQLCFQNIKRKQSYFKNDGSKNHRKQEINTTRDTLLPKLMSGEIEIPDDIEVNEDELSI